MITHKIAPLFTILFLLTFIHSRLSAQDTNSLGWNVIKEDGKPYVPVSDIEKFYQFKGGFFIQKPPSYRMFHTNLELGFQFQDNELLFNKVRIATLEPMIKQKKDLLISVQDLSSIVNPVLNPQRINCKRISQLVLSFGSVENQVEPVFYNATIKKASLFRVESINPGTGGIAIQINRKGIEDGHKQAGVIWTYLSEQKKVALNHRNIALAASMSAYLKKLKSIDVAKVEAKNRTVEVNADLIIDLAVEAGDEEQIWMAVLQSLQKFNYSLGR